MENTLVTVIVPIYKAENTLRKCVDSILNQTHQKLDILLINDGSPDNCAEFIDNYAEQDHRIKVIHQKNAGVAAARNAGLRIACGDYITFVDADDWIDLDYVRLLLSSPRHADIIRCKFCYEFNNGSSEIEDNNFEDGLYIQQAEFKFHIYNKMLEGIKMNSIWRTLYKRDVLKNVFFNENLATAEDLLFCMAAYTNAKSFMFMALPLYHYYQNPHGLTGSGLSVMTKLSCNLTISQALVQHLPIWGMYSTINILRCYKRIFNIILLKANRINTNNKITQ